MECRQTATQHTRGLTSPSLKFSPRRQANQDQNRKQKAYALTLLRLSGGHDTLAEGLRADSASVAPKTRCTPHSQWCTHCHPRHSEHLKQLVAHDAQKL